MGLRQTVGTRILFVFLSLSSILLRADDTPKPPEKPVETPRPYLYLDGTRLADVVARDVLTAGDGSTGQQQTRLEPGGRMLITYRMYRGQMLLPYIFGRFGNKNRELLRDFVMKSETEVQPHELVKKAIELEGGKVNRGMMLVWDLFAENGRDYKSRNGMEWVQKLKDITGERSLFEGNKRGIFGLKPTVRGDNYNAWMHFMGNALLAYSAETSTKTPLSGEQMGAIARFFGDNLLHSQYIDPEKRALMDEQGVKFGKQLARNFMENRTAEDLKKSQEKRGAESTTGMSDSARANRTEYLYDHSTALPQDYALRPGETPQDYSKRNGRSLCMLTLKRMGNRITRFLTHPKVMVGAAVAYGFFSSRDKSYKPQKVNLDEIGEEAYYNLNANAGDQLVTNMEANEQRIRDAIDKGQPPPQNLYTFDSFFDEMDAFIATDISKLPEGDPYRFTIEEMRRKLPLKENGKIDRDELRGNREKLIATVGVTLVHDDMDRNGAPPASVTTDQDLANYYKKKFDALTAGSSFRTR